MKTTLDRIDIVWQHLNSSSLKDEISGLICKVKRPAGSKKEDVVINALFVDNEQLQGGIININVYAANKPQNIDGVQDASQPYFERLKELTAIAVSVLDEVWIGDYHFVVQQQNGPIEDEANQYFINIRLQFFYENF